MNRWLDDLRADLVKLTDRNLLRRLELVEPHGPRMQVGGRSYLNFASNDYLGLSQHPALQEAAVAAVRAAGTGAGSSRLVGGHQAAHAQLEARFARFKHAEAALLCPTGFMANLATLTSLARPGDLICLDKLNHASLIDAARASGAQVRVYPHGDLHKLERLLERAANTPRPGDPRTHKSLSEAGPIETSGGARKLIVTDSVFSMDGDVADLPALCDLADRFDAILVVDEAHGTGVLGQTGAGLAELQGVAGRVDVVISTASKALGSLGGLISARQEVIDTVVNRGRSFIYTTAVPPAQAATINAALDVIETEPWRRQRLLTLSSRLPEALAQQGWHVAASRVPTPIIPLIVGTSEAALALASHLREQGIYAPAIRPPTVPPGSARVRLSLRADLDDRDIERLLAALKSGLGQTPPA